MKVIILNSGRGARLRGLTEKNPKSLVPIQDNENIFSRAISILFQFNFSEFIITTGYLNNILEKHAKENFPEVNFTFVNNLDYDKTNYIKSLDLIDDTFDEDVVLLHGDLVFSKKVAENIINAKNTSVVVDSTVEISKKDFKAKILNDKVKLISVNYFEDDAIACQPFYKLTNKDWKLWKNKINEFCNEGKVNVYAEEALNILTDKIELNPFDIKGELCAEIDTWEDFIKIKEILG